MDYMLSPRIQEQTRGKELCNFFSSSFALTCCSCSKAGEWENPSIWQEPVKFHGSEAERSLCLILKGCYVWKHRLISQPRCQHADKQDDICSTLFHRCSLCKLKIGGGRGEGWGYEVWGCVGREAITSVQGKVFADGECGWQRGSGAYLMQFTLLHRRLLGLYILHLPNSQATSSIA